MEAGPRPLGGFREIAVVTTAVGHIIAGSDGGAITLWAPALAEPRLRYIAELDGMAEALAVTAAGMLLTGGHPGDIRLWNPAIGLGNPHRAAAGRLLARLDHRILSIAVTADGRVACATATGIALFQLT